MKKVLVIGANGLTGKIICQILSESSTHQAIAMIRKKEQAQYFESLGVSYRIGDLEKDFSAAFEGIDLVIFAAGSGSTTGPDKTISVDQEGAKKAVDFAEKHQLKKYVMLSSIGTYKPEKAGDLEHYIRAKKEADDYLRKSKINFSIVQPGALTNDEETGKIKTAKQLRDYGEISRKDVAKILIECLEDQVAQRISFEVVKGDVEIKKALKELN